MQTETRQQPLRAIIAAVQLQTVSDVEFESSLTELRELAKTLGYEVVNTFTQKRASFDRAAYLGTGKREEIRDFVANEPADADNDEPVDPRADILLIDHDVSPSQARNL